MATPNTVAVLPGVPGVRYVTQRHGLKFGEEVPVGTDVTEHLLASPRAIHDLISAGFVVAFPANLPAPPAAVPVATAETQTTTAAKAKKEGNTDG